MNTPSPLVPQGALSKNAAKGGSNVRIVFASIVAVHVLVFGLVLMQGCGRSKKLADSSLTETNSLPAFGTTDTNSGYYGTNALADSLLSTNTYAASHGTNSLGRDYGYMPAGSNYAGSTLPPTNAYEPIVERSAAPAAATGDYKIKKGDTLAKIAKANGVSLKALSEANPNVDPSKLKIGQAVTIPAGAARPATTVATPKPSLTPAVESTGKTITHKVKAGDTLTKLARQYGTTATKIREANGMKTTRLVINKELKIPAPAKVATNGVAPR